MLICHLFHACWCGHSAVTTLLFTSRSFQLWVTSTYPYPETCFGMSEKLYLAGLLGVRVWEQLWMRLQVCIKRWYGQWVTLMGAAWTAVGPAVKTDELAESSWTFFIVFVPPHVFLQFVILMVFISFSLDPTLLILHDKIQEDNISFLPENNFLATSVFSVCSHLRFIFQ
jgi:hypothetical protein